MWNLVEPELLRMEPLCGRFRAAAPNHPEGLLEEPQALQAVVENSTCHVGAMREVCQAGPAVILCWCFGGMGCLLSAC